MTIYTLKVIETPRLIIRPIQLGDEKPLNKAINHSLELLKPWMPWAVDPSIDATRRFVQRGVFAWKSHAVVDFPMVLIHKADNKIIGASGYNDRSDLDLGLYETGYWCDMDYLGQGLITECANALTRYAFDYLRADIVILMMHVNNKKSRAVAERLGFDYQGTKTRDPMDCIDNKSGSNDVFFSRNTNHLPPLSYVCEHEESDCIDTKTITWAEKELNITDRKAYASSKVVVSTPWSMVATINTGNERVFLKHTPTALALEPDIITVLRDTFNANVPWLIKQNTNLDCFLMKDSGQPLRSLLKKRFDTDLYCKAIKQFTSLQISSIEHCAMLLDSGIPDWRLNHLPGMYLNLLAHEDELIADGLAKDHITELKKLLPTLESLCHRLELCGIKASIVQPDFHDNNILIDEKTQAITFIDLGEIVVSHPFFSLTNCLYQAVRHHGLVNTDDTYHKLVDACLDNFRTVASKRQLFEALNLAQYIEPVYQALSYYRLMQACDKKIFILFTDMVG